MKPTYLTKQGLLQRSFKKLLLGGIASLMCMGVSAWATLSPLPLVCISDNNGNPTVALSALDEIMIGGSSPTITYGVESVNLQFYVAPVFVPILGQRAVFITSPSQGGPTPTELVTLSVTQLIGQNSVNIFFADDTASNFVATLALWQNVATTIPSTGGEQDISSLLSSGENLQICVDCGGQQVPDSTPTVGLLLLALAGVVLVHRVMPRRGSDLR